MGDRRVRWTMSSHTSSTHHQCLEDGTILPFGASVTPRPEPIHLEMLPLSPVLAYWPGPVASPETQRWMGERIAAALERWKSTTLSPEEMGDG